MITEPNEEQLPLSEYDQIKLDLKLAKDVFCDKQRECTRIKKELSKAEDLLVEANEAVRSATEALQTFEQTKIANVVDEDLREIEIARLSANMPKLMKLLENEAPIVLKDLMMPQDDDDEEDLEQ